ncbi:lipoate--protein ligase [Petrimonas sulfuriphila]|uniref:lipoate--protein ligase n=1 Tax=Petrimonas sulfuriphila TaxID=285070 RepID=UPI003EBA7B0C
MIYIVNKSNKPDYNIALEEYCFKKMLHHDKVFILWINEPAIIVGKHQNTIEEINSEYVKQNGIHVIRRISGGGAVYHDLNNLNYTIISNEDKGADFDFKTFSRPVIDTLADLGVKAEFTGRNDLVIDGKKICGNAQAYMQGRIMHHGCLLFDTDLTVLSKALEVPKDKIKSKSVKSVRSVVDNILPNLPVKISVNEFSDKLLEHMKSKFPEMKEYTFSEEELADIEKLRASKFGAWEWNYGHSPKFGIERQSRYTAGKIQVFADVKNALIQQIRFYGTFFGNNSNLSEVENALIGVKYTPEDVRKALSNIEFNHFFAGFSLDELTEAIVE